MVSINKVTSDVCLLNNFRKKSHVKQHNNPAAVFFISSVVV